VDCAGERFVLRLSNGRAVYQCTGPIPEVEAPTPIISYDRFMEATGWHPFWRGAGDRVVAGHASSKR